ncbi:protein kinase [Planctomycetota bacterium]
MAAANDNNQDSVINKALQKYVDAYLQGEQSDIDEFVKQYPECEDLLRQRIQNLIKINTLFGTLVEIDESDFEDTVTGNDLVGQKVGNFEIVEKIGQGGMGVVYRARDTKLDRFVAIKSMPTEMQANSIAQTRFRREAKLLASLSHPNIAVIHEIVERDESGGFLILELVPGETLAEQIAIGPLKLQDALSIALQIAKAVSAAHEHDIVHRDLKPGNIKITPDGMVKVLDFGLAKAVGGEAMDQKSTVTEPGRVIGTPAYMSPEQTRGKSIDKRSDIWSFGCVLYEMLTGKVPFEGETVSDTLANVLQAEPDWQKLPQNTPADIRSLLSRCLKKDPRHRLRDIGDASIEINETLSLLATAPRVSASLKLRRTAMIIGAAIIIVLTAIVVRFIPKEPTLPASKEIRLVVLPFENIGSPEDDYFSDGITDEIMTRLVGIHGLSVISRQSAIQYKNREKNTIQIAKKLGVDYILGGTVQCAQATEPNRPVRIRSQLIRTSDDTHIWAQTYDNDMSQIFQVQSNVAEQVAQALNITLLEPERRALASAPTQNTEAYDYYLRGNEYYHRSRVENDFRIAIQMYEKAVELDQTFALAYARLSGVHTDIYWEYYDRSEERLIIAKKTVDKAFLLNPNLPEVRLALGQYYYHGQLNYDRALEQFAIARKVQPNNSELLGWIGYVQRRQGKFQQALANIKKAYELNPLSNVLAFDVAQTFMLLRKYHEAEHYYDCAISLRPDFPEPYSWKARLYLRWQGDARKARTVALEALQNTKAAESSYVVNLLVTLDVFDGNYQGALDRLTLQSEELRSQGNSVSNALRYARIYKYMNEKELAKKYFNDARDVLESKIQERPKDAAFRSLLGIAYAGLGHKEEAIREGKLGIELLPITKDAWSGLNRVTAMAHIYVMVGEYEEAIYQLKHLLEIPSEMSIPLLQLDPAWDPLRNHPHFKKLLEVDK